MSNKCITGKLEVEYTISPDLIQINKSIINIFIPGVTDVEFLLEDLPPFVIRSLLIHITVRFKELLSIKTALSEQFKKISDEVIQ